MMSPWRFGNARQSLKSFVRFGLNGKVDRSMCWVFWRHAPVRALARLCSARWQMKRAENKAVALTIHCPNARWLR